MSGPPLGTKVGGGRATAPDTTFGEWCTAGSAGAGMGGGNERRRSE